MRAPAVVLLGLVAACSGEPPALDLTQVCAEGTSAKDGRCEPALVCGEGTRADENGQPLCTSRTCGSI